VLPSLQIIAEFHNVHCGRQPSDQNRLARPSSFQLDLTTGVSRSRVGEFGTVYPPYCGSLILNLDTLNVF